MERYGEKKMRQFPVSSAALSASKGFLAGDPSVTETATETLVTTLQPQTTQVLTNAMDKFIRETEGGKNLVRQVSLYAALPYAVAGFALGYLLGRRK